LRVIIALGKFHGVIAAVTPIGCFKTRISWPEVGRGDDIAISAPRFLGKPFHERSAVDDLAFGLGQRLALLASEELAEFVRVQSHQVEPSAQQARAFLPGHMPPAGQSRLGRRDRGLGVPRRTIGDAGDDRTIGRIGHVETSAVRGLDPFAADISLITKKFRIAWIHGHSRKYGFDWLLDVTGLRRCVTGRQITP
jgi:hypothetical protein